MHKNSTFTNETEANSAPEPADQSCRQMHTASVGRAYLGIRQRRCIPYTNALDHSCHEDSQAVFVLLVFALATLRKPATSTATVKKNVETTMLAFKITTIVKDNNNKDNNNCRPCAERSLSSPQTGALKFTSSQVSSSGEQYCLDS